MKYSVIVAINKNNYIGNKDTNNLIYHFKKDINLFKKLTINTKNDKKNIVIMGKNTYLSIPNKHKPLKDRINIVISKTLRSIEDVLIFDNVKDVLYYIEENKKNINESFVIGGSGIYQEFLSLKIIDDLYITYVNDELEENDKYIKFPYNYIENDFKLIYKNEDIDINIYNKKTYNISFLKYEFKNKEEIEYLNGLQDILNNGIKKDDRTGTGTISLFSKYIKYDIRNNKIPLLTTKRVFFRGILEELLWFISGSSNANELSKKKVHIWDKNSSTEFLDKRNLTNYEEGDIGTGYGFNLRHYGAKYKGMSHDYNTEGIDQLKYVIELIKNNPSSRRILFNYWNPSALDTAALPPCFIKGANIITLKGYKKIENIDKNDYVLSHDGSYQKVLKIYKTIFNSYYYSLNVDGIISLNVTKNHPFLVRQININDDNTTFRYSNMKYVKVEDIRYNDYIGVVINSNSIIHSNFNFINNNYYSLFGYFIRYGNIVNNKIRIRYHTKKLKSYNIIQNMFNNILIDYNFINSNNEMGYELYEYSMNDIFLLFNNNIPEYLIDLPNDYIELFLNGFNYYDNDDINYVNSNINIVLMLQRLYLKMNKCIKITFNNNYYKIKYNNDIKKENNGIIIGEYAWFRYINKKRIYDNGNIVYNLNVENTNTYTSNNLITHNCHILYQFYVDEEKKELSLQFYQRSQDYFLANNFNIVSASLLNKMLAYITGYKPGYIYQTIGDCHLYQNHLDQTKEQLERIPTTFPLLFIEDDDNEIKKIEDFKFENFKLINYNPQKTIKAEMSA